jgi:hypothetical protein
LGTGLTVKGVRNVEVGQLLGRPMDARPMDARPVEAATSR